jgi:hypothetical protein
LNGDSLRGSSNLACDLPQNPAMARRVPASLLLAVAGLAAGCPSGRPAVDALPTGLWGGEGLSLEVTATATALEFDCAHGTVEGSWPVRSDGSFSVPGRLVREQGGPAREGETADEHPATYEGHLDGTRLALDVRLDDDGSRTGPFAAVLGREPLLRKCLATSAP